MSSTGTVSLSLSLLSCHQLLKKVLMEVPYSSLGKVASQGILKEPRRPLTWIPQGSLSWKRAFIFLNYFFYPFLEFAELRVLIPTMAFFTVL